MGAEGVRLPPGRPLRSPLRQHTRTATYGDHSRTPAPSKLFLSARNDRDGGKPVEELEKPVHRSVSQFTTFVKCGEQYRLEKVEKAPSRPAAWFAQGTAFHHAAELWEASLREMPASQAVILYAQEYDRAIDEGRQKEPDLNRWLTGGRTKAVDDINRRRQRGADQLIAYMEYASTAPERVWEYMPPEVAVEVEFELDLGGIRVLGYIDQIIELHGQLMPRDLKTGSRKPDSPFQLAVYALAIEDLFGTLPRFGDFYMAKDSRPTPPIDLSGYTREKVTRWFQNLDKAIRGGYFLPNPGDSCRTCGVSDFCSAIGSRANEYPPSSTEPVND